MQKSISACLILSLMISACTTIHVVPKGQTSYEKLNAKLKEEKISITTIDGKKYKHTLIHLDTSTVTLVEKDTTRQLQTADIAQLSYKNSTKAAINSGLIFITAMIIVGGASGGKWGFAGGLIVGVLLSPIAFGIGALIGSTELYKLNEISSLYPLKNLSGNEKDVRMEIAAVTGETDSTITVFRRGNETEILKKYIIDMQKINDKTIIVLSREHYIRLFLSR